MKESVERKLESISERYEEVQRLLAEPDVIANLDKYRELNKEYTGLTEIVEEFRRYRKAQESCKEAEELVNGADDEMKDLAAEELEESKKTSPSSSTSCRSCFSRRIRGTATTASLR